MVYLALYRLENSNPIPDGFGYAPRVLDDELEVVCDNVQSQEGYQGWCTAKVVHDPDDYENFEYLVNLNVPFGMHPEIGAGEIRLKLMASRASKKQARRLEAGEVNEGAGLGEALGMEDIAENLMVIDYARRAPTLTISLEARPVGALAQFSAKNGEFEAKRKAAKRSRHLSKKARDEEDGLIMLEQMSYISGLLCELILDLVVDDEEGYSDEEIIAITERHLRFMNMGDMQSLVMGIIMGEQPDTKKAEVLNDQVNLNMMENLKNLIGTEQSQASPDIINLPPNTSETNSAPNNSSNTLETSPNGNTETTSVQPS